MVRNTLAALLGTAAVVLGFLGLAGYWVNHLAFEPEPAERIAVAVARDPEVQRALSTEVLEQIGEIAPAEGLPLPELRRKVEEVLSQAVDRALANQTFDGAWRAVLADTRTRVVADLAAWHGGDPRPEVTLNLGPLVRVAVERLKADGDPVVARALDRVELPETIAVAGSQLSESTTRLLAPAIRASELGQVALFAAFGLLTLALIVAPRGRRGRVLLLVGLAASAGALIIRALTSAVPTLAPAVGLGLTGTFVSAAERELQATVVDFLWWPLWGGVAAAVLGLIWWVAGARQPEQSRRRAR